MGSYVNIGVSVGKFFLRHLCAIIIGILFALFHPFAIVQGRIVHYLRLLQLSAFLLC